MGSAITTPSPAPPLRRRRLPGGAARGDHRGSHVGKKEGSALQAQEPCPTDPEPLPTLSGERGPGEGTRGGDGPREVAPFTSWQLQRGDHQKPLLGRTSPIPRQIQGRLPAVFVRGADCSDKQLPNLSSSARRSPTQVTGICSERSLRTQAPLSCGSTVPGGRGGVHGGLGGPSVSSWKMGGRRCGGLCGRLPGPSLGTSINFLHVPWVTKRQGSLGDVAWVRQGLSCTFYFSYKIF